MDVFPRNPDILYVNPHAQLYTGIWTLYTGATAFLVTRLWVKLTRKHGLWWDDYVLLFAWVGGIHTHTSPAMSSC